MTRDARLLRELHMRREHAAEAQAFARRHVPRRVRDELDYIARADQRPSWECGVDAWPPLQFWAFWLGVGLPCALACSYGVWRLACWILPIMWGLK